MTVEPEFALHDPHGVLGLHGSAIRLWRPGAERVHIELFGQVVEVPRVKDRGLFELILPKPIGALDYKVYHSSGLLACDPYAFLPTLGEMDTFLFNKGCHYELYKMLGAHPIEFEGVKGVRFAVWAPDAAGVALVADFNHWDGRVCPMRSLGISGVWELFVPGLGVGEKYKFEVTARDGSLHLKSDPFAFYSEVRPSTASIVFDVDHYAWGDAHWKQKGLNEPMTIYEVHLGSWRSYGGEFPTYRQLALDLSIYCKQMGFTHVELLPVMEHPLDESWGYQVTGFFSATSRYGTPADFQFFVDHLHSQGIGVLLDWVPAHFPTDEYSLAKFDGTALYEHADPKKGMHPHWNTAIFNYGRKEVCNFLIASALFWIDKMHIDGLRVDAVASMVYLDYGRKEGEWIPNPDGSNFNVEAIEFIKHLNAAVHERFPHAVMVAEESSSFDGVTRSLVNNGLGFDLKWNMGWMNDTLRYFSRDPIYRKYHQNELTFSLLYVFSEKFMSVLSHDEVVHGKGSLLNKMPGPEWQKFANLRLLYSYLICQPGKKLLFMGGEVAQWSEWYCKGQIDWYLLQYPLHYGVQQMVRVLNHFYLKHPALWEIDFSWEGYEWIDFSNSEQSIIAYLRKAKGQYLACVHNFTPEVHPRYFLALKGVRRMTQVFNSDDAVFGGSNQQSGEIELSGDGFTITLAPLATQIFEVEFE